MEADSSSTRPLKQQKPSDNSTTTDEKTLERISILPYSLIHHILSFLPAKHSLRTSILSKQWQFLWTFVPVIDFADPLNWDANTDLASMASSINTTLILHQSPNLKMFSLQFNYESKFDSVVNVWLHFAMGKNVEVIELDCLKVDTEYGETNCYVVPLNLLNSTFLVSLKLVKCDLILKYGKLINWSSLKVLSLCKMSLSNNLASEILCGSPLLEFLKLRECWGFDLLDIKYKSTRKLVVNGYGHHSDDPPKNAALKIVAPMVMSLEISGDLKTRKVLLSKPSRFNDVELNFQLLIKGADNMEYGMIVQNLLESLFLVKYLTVGEAGACRWGGSRSGGSKNHSLLCINVPVYESVDIPHETGTVWDCKIHSKIWTWMCSVDIGYEYKFQLPYPT